MEQTTHPQRGDQADDPPAAGRWRRPM